MKDVSSSPNPATDHTGHVMALVGFVGLVAMVLIVVMPQSSLPPVPRLAAAPASSPHPEAQRREHTLRQCPAYGYFAQEAQRAAESGLYSEFTKRTERAPMLISYLYSTNPALIGGGLDMGTKERIIVTILAHPEWSAWDARTTTETACQRAAEQGVPLITHLR